MRKRIFCAGIVSLFLFSSRNYLDWNLIYAAESAVADADILIIKSRVFTGEEIIKAWLDTDTLDTENLKVLEQRGTGVVTTTYQTENQKITVNWNQGAFNGAIVQINGREEKTREEWTARWLKTFEKLGISVDDSYEKKWQGENNDEEHDIYYEAFKIPPS